TEKTGSPLDKSDTLSYFRRSQTRCLRFPWPAVTSSHGPNSPRPARRDRRGTDRAPVPVGAGAGDHPPTHGRAVSVGDGRAVRDRPEAAGTAGGQGSRRARPPKPRPPLHRADRPLAAGQPPPAGRGRAADRRHDGPAADAPGPRRGALREGTPRAATIDRRAGPTQQVVKEVVRRPFSDIDCLCFAHAARNVNDGPGKGPTMSALLYLGLANAACAAALAVLAVV